MFAQPLVACFSHCAVFDINVVHIVLICGTVYLQICTNFHVCEEICFANLPEKLYLMFYSFCLCDPFAVFQVYVAGVLAGSEKYNCVLCSVFCVLCSVFYSLFLLCVFNDTVQCSRSCCHVFQEYIAGVVIVELAVNHFSTLECVQFWWILCSSIAFFLRCVFIAAAMFFKSMLLT